MCYISYIEKVAQIIYEGSDLTAPDQLTSMHCVKHFWLYKVGTYTLHCVFKSIIL